MNSEPKMHIHIKIKYVKVVKNVKKSPFAILFRNTFIVLPNSYLDVKKYV